MNKAHRYKLFPYSFCGSFIVLFLFFMSHQEIHGAIYDWNAFSGDWATGSNWTPSGPPGSGDTANIANGGTAIITTTAQSATVNVGPSTSVLTLDGGLLSTNSVVSLSTGSFLFNSGTLQAQSNEVNFVSNFSVGAFILGGSTNVIDAAGFSIGITSGMTGSGGFTLVNGSLLLTANNTYSEITGINAGTIYQGAVNTLSPNSDFLLFGNASTLNLGGFNATIGSLSGGAGSVVTNSGILDANIIIGNTGNDGVFGGSIVDGTAKVGIIKVGPGTLTLTGTNTYTGGTLITSGTLVGTTNSIQGVVVNSNATLVFAQSQSGTFVGTIIDNGVVAINSPGATVTFNTPQAYNGITLVQSGTLMIAAQINSVQVYIFSNGVLGGIGVPGNLTNFGLLIPGTSIGTFNINGNYIQDISGTLLIEIASVSSYDRVVVGGITQLNGGLQVQFLNGFEPSPGDEFTILTAAGGVTGTFSQLDFPTGFAAQVIYDPSDVRLVFSSTFSPPSALQQSVMSSTGLANFMLSLFGVPFEELIPTMAVQLKDIIFNATNTQYGQITSRLGALRAGVSGMYLGGLSKDPLMEQCTKREAKILNGEGKTLAYGGLEASRWDIFASASGIFSTISNVYDLPKISSTTGYFSVGADCRINPDANIGFYAGYQGIKAGYGYGSWMRSNGVKWGMYGTAQCRGFSQWSHFSQWWNNFNLSAWDDNFYVNAIIGGGANFFNLNRSIDIQKYHWTARSYPLGTELDSLLGVGYEFNLGGWRLGINTSMQYTYLGISSFNESRGGNFNSRVSKQTPSSFMYTLGGNISYLWKMTPNCQIFPTVGLSWQHEFLNYGQTIGARFANGMGAPFALNSATGARNNAFAIAGVTAELTSQIGAYAYYTPQFGGGQISSQGVLVGLTYSF